MKKLTVLTLIALLSCSAVSVYAEDTYSFSEDVVLQDNLTMDISDLDDEITDDLTTDESTPENEPVEQIPLKVAEAYGETGLLGEWRPFSYDNYVLSLLGVDLYIYEDKAIMISSSESFALNYELADNSITVATDGTDAADYTITAELVPYETGISEVFDGYSSTYCYHNEGVSNLLLVTVSGTDNSDPLAGKPISSTTVFAKRCHADEYLEHALVGNEFTLNNGSTISFHNDGTVSLDNGMSGTYYVSYDVDHGWLATIYMNWENSGSAKYYFYDLTAGPVITLRRTDDDVEITLTYSGETNDVETESDPAIPTTVDEEIYDDETIEESTAEDAE